MNTKENLAAHENHFPANTISDIVLLYNGNEQCTPGKKTGPTALDHYLFNLVINGKGSLSIDNQSYLLSQGYGFLVRPGQIYECISDIREPLHYEWIGFQGQGVQSILYNSKLVHINPIYHSDEWRTLEEYISDSIRAVRGGDPGSLVYCQGMLLLILAHLLKHTFLLPEPKDLTKLKSDKDWEGIRGAKISTIFQDPMTSLNPIRTIGSQITEVVEKHQGVSKSEAKKQAIDLMERVGIKNAADRFDEYPFQYSGGMRQRIVIAIALSCHPEILICDEPTTALDVTIQAQILQLIRDLQKELGFTTLYITHDLGVVANVADRVGVMYGGQIIEFGTVEEIFFDPRHPYTWALLSSLPQLGIKGQDLFYITGTPPSLYNQIKGDAFAPRNEHALKIDFQQEPPFFKVSDTHYAKTWLLDPRAPKLEKPEVIQNLHEKIKKMTDKGGAFHVE